MGADGNAALPTAIYGAVQLLCGVAWAILQRELSTVLYVSSIPLAFVNPLVSDALFVLVAVIWFVPDRRVEAVAE